MEPARTLPEGHAADWCTRGLCSGNDYCCSPQYSVMLSQNTPLFVKQFGEDDPMRIQLAVFTSLDMVEEKFKSDVPYLGLLCPLEDYKVYVVS